MASIALISQSIDPQVVQLISSLKQQKHEPFLITSKVVHHQEPLGVPIWTYFDSWSLIEAIKIFPKLLQEAPDIIHFIFCAKDSIRPAQMLLVSLMKPMPQKILVSSFFGTIHKKSLWKLRFFFYALDLLTFSTREQLIYAKRKDLTQNDTILDIIPPILTFHPIALSEAPDLKRFCEKLRPFLFLPGTFESIPRSLREEIYSLGQLQIFPPFVYLGQRKNDQDFLIRSFHLGDLQDNELAYLCSQSTAILIAFHELSILELQKFSFFSKRFKIPLIVRPGQVESLPGLCLHGKTGWILEKGLSSLRELLHDNPALKLPSQQGFQASLDSNLLESSWMDTTMNELNRLYTKTFEHRWAKVI